MLLEQLFEISADRVPAKLALVTDRGRWSYGQLELAANRFANHLRENGIRRHARVVIKLENGFESAAAILGTLKAGAVFVPVNATIKAEKLAYVLDDCSADFLVSDAEARSTQGPTLTARMGVGKSNTSWPLSQVLGAGDGSRPPKQAIDVDLASLIYTSGSTGVPKGVMVTHLSMLTALRSITSYLGMNEDDVVLNALPFSFDYGLYQFLMTTALGGTLVLHNSLHYPVRLLELAQKEGVTGLPITPTIAALLLQIDLSRYPLPRLRYITSTAAAMPVEYIRKLRKVYEHAKLFSMYGLTECKRACYLPPDQIDKRPGSVGKAIPNTEVYIVSEEGERITRPGIVGELVIRGAHVMSGYWNAPEETAQVLRPGPLPGERVLHTGDLFRYDEEGFLYWVGRRDDIIKSRGEKVSPREVEEVIAAMPGVAAVVVVGEPDPVLGSAIKACVVPSDGAELTATSVLRYCASRLEDFMIPKTVQITTEMPILGNGKVDRRQLCSLGDSK